MFPVGKRAQQRAIHDGEDGGVSADAEGESEHGDGGEAGGFTEQAKGEAEVLKKRVEEGKAAASRCSSLACCARPKRRSA